MEPGPDGCLRCTVRLWCRVSTVRRSLCAVAVCRVSTRPWRGRTAGRARRWYVVEPRLAPRWSAAVWRKRRPPPHTAPHRRPLCDYRDADVDTARSRRGRWRSCRGSEIRWPWTRRYERSSAESTGFRRPRTVSWWTDLAPSSELCCRILHMYKHGHTKLRVHDDLGVQPRSKN